MLLDRIKRMFRKPPPEYLPEFSTLFTKFQQILQGNNTVLEIMAQLEDKLSGEYIFDMNYIRSSCEKMSETVYKIIYSLNILSNNAYPDLFERYEGIQLAISEIIEGKRIPVSSTMVVRDDELSVEVEELVGSKSARLGDVRNQLRLNTPRGFVITTAAYHSFMTFNQLWQKVGAILEEGRAGTLTAAQQSGKIGELFDRAALPPGLEREIAQAATELSKNAGKTVSFAVRSSAWGEDSDVRSFAGQFLTLLNQPKAGLADAYKKVLASRFSESVLAYHDDQDSPERAPMAVTCQEMVPAKVSGVVYTVDPSLVSWDRVLVTAVFGLGEAAVSGMTAMDQYYVSRFDPSHVLERRVGVKETRTVLDRKKGVRQENVPETLREQPCLTDEHITELAQTALTLERYFRQPQDVEWAIDHNDRLVILQTRPLSPQTERREKPVDLSEALKRYPVLLSGEGQVVQRGVAAGKVARVLEDDDPDKFPQGAIAVTRYTSPRLTKIIRKTSAVITDVGSPTGHMATIAREFGVPTIVGTERGTQLLEDGIEITVDAEENKIYRGIVPEVLEYQMEGRDQFAQLPEYKILKRVLMKVAPLSLIDPASPEFTAKSCRTFHDILRFCHEKAVWELIHLQSSERRFKDFRSRKLKLPIPIGLHIIDIGQGLKGDEAEGDVESIEHVGSVPMRAILHGLTAPGAWSTEPRPLRFNDFMSSLTRFSLTSDQPQYTGQNLAVISDNYTNLSLRLGYHFNVIDTYVSENVNDNYIYFRFVGGVTEFDRRHRRGLLLQTILERYDFKVVVKGDLVVARLKKRGQRELERTLEMLGRLIGFTRQLDTEMTSDKSIERHATAFLEEETATNR